MKGNFTEAQLKVLQRILALSKTHVGEKVLSEITTFFEETLLAVPKKALFSLLNLFRNFVRKHKVVGFSFDLMLLVEKRFSDKDITLQLAFMSACASLVEQEVTDPQ